MATKKLTKFYDWNAIISRDAFMNLIIGGRSIGKTYGIRSIALQDYIKRGERFVEITRTKNEVPAIGSQYFDKLELNGKLEGWMWQYKSGKIWMTPYVDEGEKPTWEIAGYICALSDSVKLKKQTFVNVKRIIFDEAIIDRSINPYARYLLNEYSVLMNLLTTILRETPDEKSKCRVYLLANACDLVNPYAQAFKLDKIPEQGLHFYKTKNLIIDMVSSVDMVARKNTSMLAPLMNESDVAKTFDNVVEINTDFIRKRSGKATPIYALKYDDMTYSVWGDGGIAVICEGAPEGLQTFVLKTEDMGIDYALVTRTQPLLRALPRFFGCGRMFFDSSKTYTCFLQILNYIGIS